MNEQEKQLLEKYLRYIKKRRIIIIVSILIIIVISGFLLKFNFNNTPSINEPIIKENQNIIDNNVVVDDSISNSISNTTTNDKQEKPTEEKTSETKPENKQESKPISQDKVVEDVKPSKVTTNERKEDEKPKNKPANKDFLFSDGYNMDNVTSAAQDYLKSSGSSGECIPLKDKDGVYIGMRVIFY